LRNLHNPLLFYATGVQSLAQSIQRIVQGGSVVELRRRRRRLDGGAAAERPVGLVDLSDRLHLALLLHPPVLEPDLDLSLGQRQLARQLDAPAARQVAVELEVFLELERLVAGVRLTAAPALRRVGTYTAQPRTTKPLTLYYRRRTRATRRRCHRYTP